MRLGDTSLVAVIEKDHAVYGDECLHGGGKTLRDGMGFDNTATSASGALDMVITNVTIVDGVQGVVKADVGIKDGKIAIDNNYDNLASTENVTLNIVG